MTLLIEKRLFTVEEYYKLAEVGILKDDDKVELINGEILKMSPSNSKHSGTVNGLMKILTLKLHEKAVIGVQSPISLNDYSEPEPNIYLAHLEQDDYMNHHPKPQELFLVIEVANTSIDIDQQVKTRIYANANIQEYWIVNLLDNQIEIYREPKAGEYHFKQIISAPAKIECKSISFEIDYTEVFPAK